MSKLDTNFVKQLYSNRGIELTPEKLQYISENYASNEEVESSFNIKYSEPQEPKTDPEKKNQNSTATSTKTPSVSPTQQRERKPTSVGGKPIQTGASASSAGKGKEKKSFEDTKVIYINKDSRRGEVDDMSTPPPAGYRYEVVQNSAQLKKWKEQKTKIKEESLFGAPVQSFTEQKSKEFKEAKKKEIAVIDNKPVVDVTSQFNVKPKTFTEAVSTQVDNDFKVAPVTPLSVVVFEKQKQRKTSQQEGLDNYLTKESIDFEDTLAGKGFLNNVENFARGSWNTALALASNLPFGIGEKANEVIGSTGVVADKTSVDKYFNKAKQEFEKEGKSVTPEQLKEKAKEIKLKEAKDNYIENQDAEFLNEIKDEEYVDPKSGKVIKIQDALRINDFEKYNTLNKESVKYSNLLKLNKEKVDGFYNDLKQTKNVLNHQIIFGNFDYATDIYNGLLNKEDKNQDDLDFISYYETNKDKAVSSPINPNLKQIVSKLEEEIKSKADDFNSVLDTQLNYIEKFDKSFTGKEDAYDDFDNSRRSYDGVFGDKVYLSAAETVNGTIKTIQTLAELSDKLKGKIGLPLQGADSYLFNKVFKDYNYYDFSKELGKQKELVREDVKEVTNASSLLNYVSDVTATQTGQMALPMLAGYGKVAMPLLRQSAVYFSSGFGRGVGESEEFEERFKRGLVEPGEIGKVHTFAEKLIHGGITGGADILGNLPTALRLSKSFNSLLSKPETANIFWRSWTKKGLDEAKELGTDLLKENTEESLAEIFQDLSRAFVLNEDGVNIGQSIDDVIKDTTTFTLISKIFPLMGRGVINRIASTSDKNKISELEKELYYWKGKLGENVSEETKAIYSDRISKIQSNIDKTNLSIINKVKKDVGGVSAIESLNTEIDNTLQEANKINENKELSKEEKKVLLDAQKELYTSLISNRDALIDGSKTSFDLLPEEQQTKLKVEAAEAIIQEQVDKGIEKDKIQEPNAEVINKKAKELYNQKIQEDAKTKQTDGQITSEEKPATATKEQTVGTAQQEGNVGLQEEVDKLRVQEINELTENVETPENFITDGKVDAKKVSESDNAKAKEIYAKYDAKIKPLLDNIKTQEDAVQKQITNEGVLQPGQSKMGLQEMEQGDTKQEVVTKQGEEKVNTKISDPYTSIEVDRVKALPIESEDGATMNLDGSKYEDGGLVIPLASKNMNASELTPEAIQSFVDENAESVGADNVKVGIYKFPNSNQVSIDINIVADPSVREEAIAIGKELGQESLFDLDTFENVKTGSDGMNPKKLIPAEFKEIQQRLKPKSKGIEVAKDIDQAKKQVANIADKKIAKAVLNGVKAISKILPNVKVILHDTDTSFRSVSGESKNQESSGLYINGEIHINLPKANKRTVAHEIFHAILLDKVKTDANAQVVTKKMIEAIASKIEGNPTLKAKLEDFASMYDENIQDEEKLAELVGMLAENYDSFSARVKEIIKNWLNNIAKSFGVELFETNEVFDVLNTIAKRVATGRDISDKDILSIGEENISVSDLTSRFQANFKDPVSGVEFVYDKNTDKFVKLEKDGFITKDKSITDFNGKTLFLHQPDAAFSGLIFKNGELLVEGKGGMYYPIKFHEDGYFWASTSTTAKKMAEDLNKVYEANGGQILMALTTAPSDKLLSSTTAANGVMELILSKAFDKGFSINKEQIKKSLVDAANKTIVKKSLIKDKKTGEPVLDKKGNKQYKEKIVGLNFRLKKGDSLDNIKSEIKKKLNPENSSFDDRKTFVEGLLSEIANVINLNPKAVDQFGKFFSEGIKNKAFKGVSKTGKLSVSAANLKQAVSEMLTEPMLKEGVERNKGGQVYAIIELNGNVKPVDSNKHESYPKAIQSVDTKNNKVTLHILKDRVKWNEVFEDPTTNEIVSKDRELNIFPTSGVSTTGLKLNTKNIKNNIRQQKALPEKVAEKLTEDSDGNFVFKHYSDQKRDVIKKGQGNNAITSREEASALSAVGGLAMFYTMEGQKETGVGNVEHNILISKDKIYDIDSDPLGFEGEARKRFNQVRPGQEFTNNHRGAFITQIANENGFDVAVTQWRGSELRAQTTKELTPSDKAIDFKERPLDTFKVGDRAIIDGKESVIESVKGQKIGYKSIDGTSQGVTINNERNRRSIIKIEPDTSVRKQKPSKQELSDAKKEIQEVFSAAKEALKIEKDRNKVINRLKVDANAFIKASITDLKAGDVGNRAITSIASKIQSITDQNFEEKLLEINTVLDNLYTNRDVNTAKADSKKAFKNVMSGKVGKLDERGDRDNVMSSKVVNFTKLEPKTLKKVVDEADFKQYKDYIGRLAGRGLTLEETDLPTIEKIFDKLVKPYSDYVAEVNRIQQIIDAGGTLTKDESDFIENNSSDFSERETPETLADKEAKKSERDAKKEEEIAKKKASIKELLPSIKSVFESSNAVKGSLEWRMLNSLMGLSESDVDSMPDNMLTNALNAISSMVYDDVIPAYTEDLYKYKLKTDYKNALVETLKKSGKAGVYKLKVAKIPLKIREVIGLPLMSLIKGINQKNINQQVIDRRIKFFNLSAMDAAVKVYGDTPLFNAFMSSFGKAMSRIASSEEKVESVLLRAKRDLDKNSKNPQESYMKIVYHLIDTMAKNNVGTTSSRSAMEYFEATVNDTISKIYEDNYMKGLVQGFIDKVNGNDNKIEDLTPEEANAANAIRMVLEENQINAYEANLFQNSNAAPMIVEYFPVFNSVVKQAENDLARLKSKFGIDSVSIKAGSLEDKTGTAHPIDLNPFTSAFSSVRNVLFQHQLRSEYAAITQAIKEAIAENSKDNDVLPYLMGIQKALNSQFDLLINGAIHTEPTLTDKILNGTDRAFYTLALGSIISRGVDFAGNMVQLMTINPKYISYSNKMSNALINIKEDGESETELIRKFYENIEASDVNKMISSKKINTERTEFINRGINKEVLSKGLPSSNIGLKIKTNITGPIRDTASGAVDTLLGFGDVKPYAISWNGVFYEEFLKQTGEDINVEKIARGDAEYLKKYKDAISKASNKANQENADLYGSTNPMEKKVGIMEIASKQVKNSVPGAVNALVNKAAYLFSSFDMNARNDINTAVNTYIENQEGRNARRFLGGAIRLASYSLAINYITGAMWGLFKGDDDDEEKLKVSFDKLSGDDDFIKEVNNSLLDYPIQKDADGNIIELTREDLVKYNKMRDKLMQNKDFAAAYDIVYGYVNRDLFDNQVKNKIGEINSGKYEYDKSLVEVFFSDMDKGFGKSDDEIIGVLGLLNSQQGYKLFTQDQIDSYTLKLEKYMSDTKFLSNRAIRESNKQIDRLIITKTASILSDYRSNKSIGDITTTEGLKLFMGMMLSRSNNFTKAAYNYAAELSNKQLIQARRGERGYDAFKDNVFQTPVKAGLTEKASKQQLTQDVFNILFPALTKMDRYMATDYAVPDLVRFTPLGILGVNDFSKIDSKMRNDVIYQNTNGKYRENIIKDIEESKIDILRSKEDVEKDSTDNQFRKSRVIPGVKETQLKSRFPSYKEGKDLKVNGNRAN